MEKLAVDVSLLSNQQQERLGIVGIQHILAGMAAVVEVFDSKELKKLCCLHLAVLKEKRSRSGKQNFDGSFHHREQRNRLLSAQL